MSPWPLQGLPQKELAPIHSVKYGILQNACSTSRKMDADLGKSALMHTARLKNSLATGLKRICDKSAVAMLKRSEQPQRTGRLILDAFSSSIIVLRISGYGAAEVFIDFAEELKHTETNQI